MAFACFGRRRADDDLPTTIPDPKEQVRRNSLHRVLGVYDDQVGGVPESSGESTSSSRVCGGYVSSDEVSVHTPTQKLPLACHVPVEAGRPPCEQAQTTSSSLSTSARLPSSIQAAGNVSIRIGAGAFSTVYLLAQDHSGDVPVAVKAIPVETAEDVQSAAREFELGRRLASNPACRFPAVIDSDFSSPPGPDAFVYITFELFQGGTLEQLLNRRRVLPEKQAKAVAFALFSAIAAIHKEKIVHSDIKPANLMFYDAEDMSSLRVVDLGMAANLKSGSSRAYEVGGTMAYFSPEQVRTWYTKQPGFSFATDIWSAGVVVFEMLSGRHPFISSKDSKTLRRICVMEPRLVSGTISEEAKDFVGHVLAKEPSKRITAKEALKHPWFAEYRPSKGKSNWLNKLVGSK